VTSRVTIPHSCTVHVPLAPFSASGAADLLREVCASSAGWDAELTSKLAQLCGCNALCLTIVGSFINAGRCTLQVCDLSVSDSEIARA
jgi:hypothetical protein